MTRRVPVAPWWGVVLFTVAGFAGGFVLGTFTPVFLVPFALELPAPLSRRPLLDVLAFCPYLLVPAWPRFRREVRLWPNWARGLGLGFLYGAAAGTPFGVAAMAC